MWLICTNIALIALQPLQAAAPPTEVEVRDVRRMLRVVDQDGGEQNTLIELGERVFPIFVIILDSRDLKNVEQSAIFSALSEVKADRSRFLGYALKSLAHKSDMVRASSIHLLEKIGSSRDSAPLVALLSDADSTISRRRR